MIEEPTDLLLDACGEDLEFPSGVIRGISFADLMFLESQQPYVIQKLEITFLVKTLDLIENDIREKDTFNLIAGSTEYQFSIKSPPISDLAGWSLLSVNFIGRNDV